jgi:hypothetical protein
MVYLTIHSDALNEKISLAKGLLPDLKGKLAENETKLATVDKEIEDLNQEHNAKFLRRTKMQKTNEFIEKRLNFFYTNKELADMVIKIGDVSYQLFFSKKPFF